MLWIDPQKTSEVLRTGYEHNVIDGRFYGMNKRGEAVNYTYTAHTYVNVPRSKEYIGNMVKNYLKEFNGDLVKPLD
jgi:hypothetical protein